MSAAHTATAVEKLESDGFLHDFFSSSEGDPQRSIQGWEEFAGTWSDLRPDTYMADGGNYRLRRYSEFSMTAASGEFELLPHVPYSQDKSVNHLNGGISRSYKPFSDEAVASPVLAGIFEKCGVYLESVRPGESWRAQCFQNRILTSVGEVGQPAPEGIHRDGVDYVLTFFVDRVGAEGGESSVYLASNRSKVDEVQLSQPGEYLFVDDHKLLHDVTGLTLADNSDQGHRDVLIAMFSVISD
ncbi:2OG-Fe dioxygenase family protein [Arthrobacter sp. CAN_A1]|uniref:2OG-Fe dioxygenase family protein n=1 Tax=Arthrobacter sp. CAN_A1 TaxID=2787717 RepID=UPI0018C9E2F0